MKIIITGAAGMLGAELVKIFRDFNPVAVDREGLDVTDRAAVFEFIKKAKPNLILNAAAYTDVEGAEDSEEEAAIVNGAAVGYIAEAAAEVGATVVHYSTDYVFDGQEKGGYAEDARPAEEPLNIYGATKLLGEMELVKNMSQYYLIRTSWLFGFGGKNFVDTMLRLGSERDEVKVVNDQHGKPTYTPDLALATRQLVACALLENFNKPSNPPPTIVPPGGTIVGGGTSVQSEKLLTGGMSLEDTVYYPHGIYHITNEGATTWYDFAKEIFKQADLTARGCAQSGLNLIPVTSAEFPTKARRPAYGILKNTKFPPLRPWQSALKDYLNYSS